VLPTKPLVVIAAIASRIYVKAAVAAGYDVIAIDCYVDAETESLATITHRVDFKDEQLCAEQVFGFLSTLALDDICGFCYGAGFEKQAQALKEIASMLTVIGNSAAVVECCKNPQDFFACCQRLGVAYPETSLKRPTKPEGWLQKTVGGSGGSHIKALDQRVKVQTEAVYFQRNQKGLPVSCLFLVSNSAGEPAVQVVGFNEQWVSQYGKNAFCYSGAVSNVELNEKITARFTKVIKQLASDLGLTGLNSCDAICDRDDMLILEVNPRLSASLALYPEYQSDLLQAHITGQQAALATSAVSVAHQVIYASQTVTIRPNVVWPAWAADLPKTAESFTEGMPICTVTAQADTAAEAKRMLHARVDALNRQLFN